MTKIKEQIPHSQDYEDAILCCCLIEPVETMSRLEEAGCSDSWFYTTRNKIFWYNISEIYRKDGTIDELSLIDGLKRNDYKDKDEKIILSSVLELSNKVDTISNLDTYIKHCKGYAVLRGIHKVSIENIELSQKSEPAEYEEALGICESRIYGLARGVDSEKGFEPASAAMDRAIAQVNRAIETRGESESGFLFGLSDIDKVNKGLKRQELMILAARPSVGKTALSLQAMDHVCVTGGKIGLYVSLEMGNDKLAKRMLFQRAKLNRDRVIDGFASESEMALLRRSAQEISDSKLYFDETPGLTASMIRARARRYAAKMGGLDLLMVDYVGLISPEDSRASRNDQLGQISNIFVGIKKELNCSVVLLSQLSRDSEKHRRQPNKSDLRDSGNLEQDADQILFLWRDEWADDYEHGVIRWYLDKNREGEISSSPGKLTFVGGHMRFYDYISQTAYDESAI